MKTTDNTRASLVNILKDKGASRASKKAAANRIAQIDKQLNNN